MDPTVIVALIALVGTIASGIISALIARKTTLALVEYRLLQLEHKMDKHNNLIERMYVVEGKVNALEHDVQKGGK